MKITEKPMAQQTSNDAILTSIITTGDLSKLSADQKVAYYRNFCERLGLDPISQPFKLLRLNGREILYCDRTGAQQLNKLHSVSHEIRAREIVNGCYVVTSQASTPDGRHTESIGAVTIENLKGDNLCNAMMKAETKAKRRATLDLLGLGILDETETETIPAVEARMSVPVEPAVQKAVAPPAPVVAENPAVETPEPVAKAPEKAKKAVVSKEAEPKNVEKVKMLPPDTKAIDPMKTKYSTAAALEMALGNAFTVSHLADLYYVNIETIEKNAALKALFTARKLQITSGALQADAMAA